METERACLQLGATTEISAMRLSRSTEKWLSFLEGMPAPHAAARIFINDQGEHCCRDGCARPACAIGGVSLPVPCGWAAPAMRRHRGQYAIFWPKTHYVRALSDNARVNMVIVKYFVNGKECGRQRLRGPGVSVAVRAGRPWNEGTGNRQPGIVFWFFLRNGLEESRCLLGDFAEHGSGGGGRGGDVP